MIYIDTSVAVSLLIPEPKTQAVKAWFASVEGISVAGDWLLTEFASAVSIKVRAQELAIADARAVRKEFDRLTANGLRVVPVSREAFRKAAELAAEHTHGLRAGDALHLALAREIGAKSIATLDGRMAANAARLKLKVEEI